MLVRRSLKWRFALWTLYPVTMEGAILTHRALFARRGRRLEYFTIAWNALEGFIALIAGAIASSISLLGFGVDSYIEVVSGAALLWRMSTDANALTRERNEKIALRIVGICFLGLAAYVAYDSLNDLVQKHAPERSVPGAALAFVSLIVMPLLSRAKKAVADALASAAMNADARQTEFCAYLSAILLIGLLLNAILGLWWADPVAALLMVPIIGKEGVERLRVRSCGNCHSRQDVYNE
jgi:divalent metal cation (Fe/Co/Zn/Cd) transporter